MYIPETPQRLSLHTISRHLLGAKTNWQNVLEEASDGCDTARDMVAAHKKHHTVSVDMLKAYLAHLSSRQNVWTPPSDDDPRSGALSV